MQGKQSPILRVLTTEPREAELSEREHVEQMLSELAEIAARHLPHLSSENPWRPAAHEILQQASRTLGRRRVRLESHG